MKKLHLLLFAALALLLVSCSSDDNFVDETPGTVGDYTYGLFVLTEGNFGTGNSEVSFIDNMYTGVSNNIFGLANNGDALGDVAQSIAFYEDHAFVVVNNSHKIVVVNRHDFTLIDVIDEGINNPRYMTIVNGKGYVTNWGDPNDPSDDFVAVIDLESLTVAQEISVDFGPEKLVFKDGFVYVAHKGGYSQNNKLSVIDANSNSVTEVVEVGDIPNSLQLVGNDLWVLSGGKPGYADGGPTNGRLVKIDLGSLTVTGAFDFEASSPSHLAYDGGHLYYTISSENWTTLEAESSIYALDLESQELPTEPVFQTDKAFYGVAIKDGKFFGGDAKDYVSSGSVYIYDLTSGDELHEFSVGISPSGFYFTE